MFTVNEILELSHSFLPFINMYLLIVLVRNSNYMRKKSDGKVGKNGQ